MSGKNSVSGSIYLNRDRYWWNVTLPGETKRKSIPLKPAGAKYATKDYHVAVEVAKEILLQHLNKSRAVYIPGSIAELCDMYLSFARDYYSHTNESFNIKYALDFLTEEHGDMPIEDFGPVLLDQLRSGMIDKGLCRTTINQRVGMIKRMFKWGVSKEIVPSHVFQRLSTLEGLKRGRSQAKSPVR
ncbi:MAG: hypothetical protein JXA82_10790 [Sedimentisphaerales bacterium]|nr:hypothetical protein [Sedimentisphaerales bacterium]